MAQSVRNNRRTNTNGYSNAGRYRNTSNGVYTYGNTARQLDVKTEIHEQPRRRMSHEVRHNREKALHMNFGYVVFLLAAIAASAIILANYIQLQAELTNKTRVVSSMEKQLNNLKLANDEEYNRITSSIDLEEIKRIAIGELGMVYASEGQIVKYSNVSNDYMRSVSGK